MTPQYRMSVLVIDDQRFQRSFLARLLRELGVEEIYEACNGQNALDMLTELGKPVDLIISDIDMPKMDGLEFLRWLGRLAPHTPILIHSALEHGLLRSVEAMAVEYGLTPMGILEDPVTVEGLRQVLERAQTLLPKDRRHDENHVELAEIEEGVRLKQFEPWFQPKVDLRSGRVIGVEALLRWRRDRRIVLPAAFVPQLEASPLMKECTLRIAARAAECINLLPTQGGEFSVAINVGPTLLEDPAFASELSSAMLMGGAKPEQIIIEVTETAMTRNQGAMLENLARMRMRGFRISLDDFCTGYSSMARLARSPFCEIKIDRSFVGRMYQGNREWLLIESTVALAQRLGLRTVAEGVESDHQLQALKQFGCDAVQGYLIAKPMPVLELMQWMDRANKSTGTATTTRRSFGTQTLDGIVLEESATVAAPGGTVVAMEWLDRALSEDK